MDEAKKRDYKAEYKKFQSSTKMKKYRAELNKYNRQKGTYGNGDKKDASHKGGKIVGFENQSKNRGRAEKSRLKKEGKELQRWKVYIKGEKEPFILTGSDKNSVKKFAHQMIKNNKVKIARVVKEGKLTESDGTLDRGEKALPSKIKIYMKRFTDELNKANLNKIKKVAVLYKIIQGLGLKPQEMVMYVQKIKKGMKSDDSVEEGKLKEGLTDGWKNDPWEVYVRDEKGKEKIMKLAKSKRAAVILYNKLAKTDKYHEVGMRVKGYNEVKEGKLNEAKKETIFDVAARVVKNKSMEKYKSGRGQVMVDMQSANLLVKVFKKVNPKMKKILSDLGYKNPAQLMSTLWAVAKAG